MRPIERGGMRASILIDCRARRHDLLSSLRLQVHQHVPQYGGPLRRLVRLYRLETGWWESTQPTHPAQGLALRDYFIAQSPEAGLVWIYRERPAPPPPGQPGWAQPQEFRWYLQGLYA
jgi:protein ImuB